MNICRVILKTVSPDTVVASHFSMLFRAGFRRSLLLLLATMAVAVARPAAAASLVASNGTWRYFPGTSEASTPTNLWRMPGFDDSAWAGGAAPFHYGTNSLGGDDWVTGGTILSGMSNNYTCLFLRQSFVIADTNTLLSLNLGFVLDDGIMVWLNGAPLQNAGAPANLSYTNSAGSPRENQFYPNNDKSAYRTNLVNGTNVLTVQAFNYGATNDDFRFAVWLDVTFRNITPPQIADSVPAAGAVVSNLTTVTVRFDEPVQGVDAGDLLLNHTPALTVVGNLATNVYIFTFASPQPGQVFVEWNPGHGITDLDGFEFNENAAGSSWTYTLVDTAPPVVASTFPVAGSTVRNLSRVEVTFNEPVQGLEAADLRINGVPAASASGVGAGPYLFSFPQPASGAVLFTWAAGHGIADLATPANAFGGGSWSLTLNPAAPLGDIVLNEFLSANISTNGLREENGDWEDWIELFNRGTNPVNLAGWSLSDDPNNPGQWTFPATNIGPGKFVLVWASAKDRRVPGAPLHTSFKLAVAGEYLGLFSPELPRQAISEFRAQFPEQRNDYSYGLVSSNAYRYFLAPTPGTTNGASLIAGVVPKPHASVSRGVFEQPFTVVLSDELPDAALRYTLDGSAPVEATSALYTGPLRVASNTVLRVVAFRTNMLPSSVSTHTYLFLDDILRQPNNPPGYPVGPTVWTGYPSDYEMDPEIVTNANYGPQLKAALQALPALSIVASIDDMFGPTRGIYTHASDSQTLYRGIDWERACSAELILTNGDEGFQVDCGIRLQGNASRNPSKTSKHPFRLLFRGDYGAGQFEYPVFPDSPVQTFNTLILRADFNNSWLHSDANQRLRGTRIRDAWAKDAFREMGQMGGHSRHVHLFINGLYWGVYDFGERIDAAFAASYLGGQDTDYDAIASKPTEAIDGDLIAYNAMIANVRSKDMRAIANYTAARGYLDMTNYADYILLNFFAANQDWGFDGNWNAVHKRAPGALFEYCAWDGERYIENTGDNRVSSGETPPSGLHSNLVNSAEYRLFFADRAHKHLFNGGALTTNRNIARWLSRAAVVDTAIIAESARWGDNRRDVMYAINNPTPPFYLYTRNDHWLPEINRMATNYFPLRPATVLSQLRTAGLYPNVSAPVFSQFGGRVPAGFALTMIATNPVYYTLDGTDPRIYGTGAIAPWAQLYSGPVTLNQTVVVKARARFGTNWSALNEATFTVGELGVPLRITEINYNPPGGDAFEFFELYNAGTTPVELGGWYLEGVSFVFPASATLPPGGLLVLASAFNTNAFKGRYPGVPVFGWYSGALNNGGERLAVKNTLGQTIAAVTYGDNNGWPASADGGGYSIEFINLNGDPNAPANWRASGALYGTPGLLTSAPTPPQVVLNEVMAENLAAVPHDGQFPDWIELRNTGASPVALDGWSLTDDGNARRFVFPNSTVLNAGGYLVIWCDTNTAAPGLHTGFALDRDGENILLYDAGTNLVDALSFGRQVADFTLGRIGGAWQLTVPTPEAANTAATLGSQTNLAINEWLADALPGSSDWIELYNRSATAPVSLQGIYFTTSNALAQPRALSFLESRGFAQLFADTAPGPAHLGFSLPKEGGLIALFDATGGLVEQVIYGSQSENVSQGRLPDGALNSVSFPGSQSPGATNYLSTYAGPVLNEIMARNRSAVVSPGGQYADWVELRNSSGAAFDLSGMGLSDNAAKPTKWVFPAGTTLAAGGHLLVWCDGSRRAGANGADLNTGFSLDGTSGGVYLFSPQAQLVNSIEYGFQISDRSIGLSGGQWRLLSSPTPGAANAAAATLGAVTNLCVNEWLANPLGGDDWFETFNRDALPVDLVGLYLTDDPSIPGVTKFQIAPLNFIDGRGWVQWLADGNISAGRNHTSFTLDGSGETIRIYATPSNLVDAVDFGLQSEAVSQGRLPDGATNIVSFPVSTSPGAANYLPLTEVVINEVLAHSDAPLEDAIELHNPTAGTVNIGGWYLSNTESDPKRCRLTNGLAIPPGGFTVLYEWQFNPPPGAPPSFTLNSAHGDQVYLSEADGGGNLTGRRASVSFGATENGVSLGRVPTSQGVDFAPLNTRTFGEDTPATVAQFRTGTGRPNATPKVGPVVINEIQYHPTDVTGATLVEPADEEFIELRNLGGAAVPLFDPAHTTNRWTLAGAVDFTFPPNVTMSAGQHLLIVHFDPVTEPASLAAFRARYAVPTDIIILGPWSGRLDNAGEAVELYRPDAPQSPASPDAGFVPQLLIERVNYGDAAPWPVSADGGGASLQRVLISAYGNEPTNWFGAAPTPGRTNALTDEQPPTITTQPLSLAVFAGQPATFNVTAVGAEPLCYQWQCNGAGIPGATNTDFSLSAAQSTNAGSYVVRVTNLLGVIFSQPALLAVLAPPTIVSVTPSNRLNAAGSVATFAVVASGAAPLSYQWQFNGGALPAETNATLTMNNVQPAKSGGYRVVVTNLAGAATSSVAPLTVMFAPAITLQPQSQTVSDGSNALFSVSVTGDPTLSYQWFVDGSPILGATDSTLTRHNVTTADNGKSFTVQITNPVGMATSGAALLNVVGRPLLSAPQRGPGSLVNFVLLGQPGRSYFLEVSSNLTDWVTLTNTTYHSGQTVVVDASVAAQQFQRVSVAP